MLHILTGEATPAEKEKFYRQLATDKNEEELFYEVKSLWLQTSMQNTVVDTDSDFADLWKRIKNRPEAPVYSIRRKMLRYAAVFLMVLGLGTTAGYFIAQHHFRHLAFGTQTYSATRGSVSIVEFADGSKVWLNSESKLTYYEDRQNNQRMAELTGEAYFEIAHREDFPFVVKAGQLVVRDLGTTFNIKAYPEDNYIETSLVEGAADILSGNGKTILALKPGESAMYFPEANKMVLRSIAENVLSAWRDGKFVIRDQRLEDIFRELSRWYGIEFRIENDKLRDYRFTGNIKKTITAQHVLKMLKTAAGFDYRIVENVDKPDIVIVY